MVLNEADKGEISLGAKAQLSIIKDAFRESQTAPVCCFSIDNSQRILCDTHGPLKSEQFMEKCRICQTQIKKALAKLQTD